RHVVLPGNGRCVARHDWQYPHAPPTSRDTLLPRNQNLPGASDGSPKISNSLGSHAFSNTVRSGLARRSLLISAKLPVRGWYSRLALRHATGICVSHSPARPQHLSQARVSCSLCSVPSTKPGTSGRDTTFALCSAHSTSEAKASASRP